MGGLAQRVSHLWREARGSLISGERREKGRTPSRRPGAEGLSSLVRDERREDARPPAWRRGSLISRETRGGEDARPPAWRRESLISRERREEGRTPGRRPGAEGLSSLARNERRGGRQA